MSRSRRNAKADEYFRRAPNYSAEAIAHFTAALFGDGIELLDSDSAAVVSMLLPVLETSHKFAVPDYGILLGNAVTPSMYSHIRLPFERTVIEFASPPKILSESPDNANMYQCQRHIVACENRTINGLEGARVWGIGYTEEELWIPDRLGFFFPYCQPDKILIVSIGNSAAPVKSKYQTQDAFTNAIVQHCGSSLRAATQLCAILGCSNVSTEVLAPNREARAARPESTLFDYHVLMIRPGAERHEGPPLGGSHASPRTHLRRGHIRQHPTAGRIWVNSCVVNPTAIGSVNKDYQLQGGIQ